MKGITHRVAEENRISSIAPLGMGMGHFLSAVFIWWKLNLLAFLLLCVILSVPRKEHFLAMAVEMILLLEETIQKWSFSHRLMCILDGV